LQKKGRKKCLKMTSKEKTGRSPERGQNIARVE